MGAPPALRTAEWSDLIADTKFSASIGVGARRLAPGDALAATELYQAADRFLYAKKTPRQRLSSEYQGVIPG
jgi:hypothetical protein